MGAYATGIVRKFDNGYRGVFVNESERGLWAKGEELFNRQLHPFAKGKLLRVVMEISPKGRKMVKSVAEVKDKGVALEPDAPVAVETAGTLASKLEELKADMPEGATVTMSFGGSIEEEIAKAKAKKVQSIPAGGYYVGPEERLVFNTVLGMSLVRPEKAVKVMMIGPSGYGKTTLPKLFAELSGKSYLRMNCATVRDPEEWFGFREAREGSTVFVRSQFAKALEAGNLVVVLDEFNRLEPWLHNTLFPLLDDDGCTVVHEEKFTIGPGVVVVGTINSGYKYTGTFELDEALMNRFEFILEVGPMPFVEEVKVLIARTGIDSGIANQITKVAGILRQNEVVCSTRSTLLIANMVVAGLQVREAFETAVVKRIPADASGSALRKQVVDLINVELGPCVDRVPDLDIFNLGEEVQVAPEEQRHLITLFLSDRSKVQTLRLVQLIKSLDVAGAKLSLARANSLARSLIEGESVGLELRGKPEGLDEFLAVGVMARYSTAAA